MSRIVWMTALLLSLSFVSQSHGAAKKRHRPPSPRYILSPKHLGESFSALAVECAFALSPHRAKKFWANRLLTRGYKRNFSLFGINERIMTIRDEGLRLHKKAEKLQKKQTGTERSREAALLATRAGWFQEAAVHLAKSFISKYPTGLTPAECTSVAKSVGEEERATIFEHAMSERARAGDPDLSNFVADLVNAAAPKISDRLMEYGRRLLPP